MRKLFLLGFILLLPFAFSIHMEEGQNFKAYLCIGKGTNETAEGTNFIADFDIGCLSEYYVCWLLGFCGAKTEQDIWGITSITLDKRSVRLIPESPEEIHLAIVVKNFSKNVAQGKLTYYVKNLVTGIKVEEKEKNLSLDAEGEEKIEDILIISANKNNFGDYRERGNYQVVAVLETIQNDDARNNRATIDFTVLGKERVAAVPETNPLVIVAIAMLLLKVLKRR